MGKTPTMESLSPGRKRLVRLMSELQYGRIEGLRVCRGEPDLDAPHSVKRTRVLGRDNGQQHELTRIIHES